MRNEELVEKIFSGCDADAAYEQLLRNLRPMICKIAYAHLRKIPILDEDDYTQEALILMWKLMSNGKVKPGFQFSNLFYIAFERRCINLYRDYVLKNMIFIYGKEDELHYGYHTGYFIEDEYAQKYRKAQSERNRRYRERKNPELASKQKPPRLTEEERKERNRQRSRAYYQANKEKCADQWISREVS